MKPIPPHRRYVLVTPERLARAEAFFSRHGGKAVFAVPIILMSLELAFQRQSVWLPRWMFTAW